MSYPSFHRLAAAACMALLLAATTLITAAAVFTCQQTIDASSLGGKTVWLTIESGQTPYETAGAYQIRLNPDGTYSVAAAGAIQARSGSWAASRPAEYLTIKLKNFHKDAVEDVLVLFDGCPSCLSCGYSFFRENLPTGGQSGTFVITDGEAPPAPPTDIGVRGMNGAGTYQSGANVSLFPQINYIGNPSTYKYTWTKDGAPLAAPIPGFYSLSNATPSDSGIYACSVSRSGITNTVSASIKILPPAAAPGFQGRVWRKVTDWVGGLSFGRTWFRVNAGVITLGGDKSVSRWSGGKLESLVTNTTAGIDGISFSWTDAVTIESEGAFNFVVRNKLYEMKNGTATLIPTPGLSVGAVSRAGSQVVFVANAGSIQNGVYLWNGTQIRTLFAPAQDPQGRLSRIDSVKSLSFDGDRVALVAVSGQDTALFSLTTGSVPAMTLLAETGGTGPSSSTYRVIYHAAVRGDLIFAVVELNSFGTSVISVERTGKVARLGNGFSGDLVTAMLSANRGRQFHHLNASALEFWTDSHFDRYLGPGERLDGKVINRITSLDANEQDVVIAAEFVDGTAAIYALVEAVAPPPRVALGLPILVGKEMRFEVSTVAGKTYVLEKSISLAPATWSAAETAKGTGNPQVFSILPEGAGAFYRVVQQP